MRSVLVPALLLVSSYSYSKTPDVEVFVKQYNQIFSDGIPVCNSIKALTSDGPGYHIAEVTKIDGSKEMLRVPQNTLGKFKKIGDSFVADFHSYRWDGKSQSSKTEFSYLKIEKSENGTPRLNMYDIDNNLQASHAIGYSESGEVEFVVSTTTATQKNTGLNEVDNVAEFYAYVIKATRVKNTINYVVDDFYYQIPKEIRSQVEKDAGRKLFTNKLDQNGTSYIGNTFSIEEIREIAAKYGLEAKFSGAKPWNNCPLPSVEDLAFNAKKVKRSMASEKKAKKK